MFTPDQDWRLAAQFRNVGNVPVLTVCGPSGAGKTTTVKALTKIYPAYIETTKGNVHLKSLLEGKANFDALANQEWFLQRAERYIAHADSGLPLVLDQDPAAIILVYSRMFLQDGKITKRQYLALFERLLKIENNLKDWKCPRTVLFLDAPADVLRQRNLQRWGKAQTLPIQWFERVRNQFLELFTYFPNAITASTDNLSPDQVVARAKSLIENRVN